MSVEVLDAAGRRVRKLMAGGDLGAGKHLMIWDGADDRGVRVPPGLYFVRARVGAAALTARVVRLK